MPVDQQDAAARGLHQRLDLPGRRLRLLPLGPNLLDELRSGDRRRCVAREDAQRLEHFLAQAVAAPHRHHAEEAAIVDERIPGERLEPLDSRPVGVGQPGLFVELVGRDHPALRRHAADGEVADGNPAQDPVERSEPAVLDEVEAALAVVAAIGELAGVAAVAAADQPDARGGGPEAARERIGDRGEDAFALEGAGNVLDHAQRRPQRADGRLEAFPLDLQRLDGVRSTGGLPRTRQRDGDRAAH